MTTIYIGDYLKFRTSKSLHTNDMRTKHLRSYLKRKKISLLDSDINEISVIGVEDFFIFEEWIIEINK